MCTPATHAKYACTHVHTRKNAHTRRRAHKTHMHAHKHTRTARKTQIDAKTLTHLNISMIYICIEQLLPQVVARKV